MVPTTHSYILVWRVASLLCLAVTYLFAHRRNHLCKEYRCWLESRGIGELMGQERTRNESMVLELMCARAVSQRFPTWLCAVRPPQPPPTINFGQFWFPGSPQLTAVPRCTWKKNPAEHAECRQSPGNSTRKCGHVQITNFQKENWLNFARFSYKIKTLHFSQRSPTDKFQAHVPVQRCTTISPRRDCHKKMSQTIILVFFPSNRWRILAESFKQN